MNDDDVDLDADIARAFEPLHSIPTPDLWTRIESASSLNPVPGTHLHGRSRRLLALAAAVLVAVGGVVAFQSLRSDSPVDVVDLVPTSTATTTIPPTSTLPSTTITEPPPAGPLFEGASWVRFDLQTNSLVSDTGETFGVSGVQFGSARGMDRRLDGTLVVATQDGVLAFSPGATEPEVLFSEPVEGVRRNVSGQLEVLTDEGAVDLGSGEPAVSFFDDRQAIGAANGFSVEVIPGDFEAIVPDALRLLQDGDQATVWDFGGPAESVVSIDDFNGRFILAHRGPQEPALPPSQHVVIDLFTGRVDSFVAIPGLAALVVPNTEERPASYTTGSLGLCSTMDGIVLPTPSQLNDESGTRFLQATLAVARCDESWLRSVFAGSAWSDAVWEQLAQSLRSVPQRTEAGWIFGDGNAAVVSIADDGSTEVTVNDGVFELRIVKSGDSVVIAGTVGPESAAGIRLAAAAPPDVSNVWEVALAETGAELGDDLRQAVEEMLGTGFRRSPSVEALIEPGRVRVISQDALVTDGELTAPLLERAGITVEAELFQADPSAEERSVVQALQTFAAGGSLGAEVVWADEVVLGAGPNEGRRLGPDDMSIRSNWLIENVPFFRASGEEAFTALAVVPDPEVISGPHNHCASPPVPAPASLAGLRRVSAQPAGDSIDSCLQWRTFDVFFDVDGRVAGVTVDWWEP